MTTTPVTPPFPTLSVSVTGIEQFATDKAQLEHVLTEVVRELLRATKKYGKFHSMHEGHSVILEELEELWDEVKGNQKVLAKEEAVQVAAMGIRFILDI